LVSLVPIEISLEGTYVVSSARAGTVVRPTLKANTAAIVSTRLLIDVLDPLIRTSCDTTVVFA